MNTDIIHPIVVHFPIALILAGFFTEVLSLFFKGEKWLSKAAFYLMVLGTLGAITSWGTGQLFTEEPMEGEIVKVFHNHETGAFITMILMIIGTGFRSWLVIQKKEETNLKWIAFGFYFLASATVAFTGFMGGKMVYEFMIGLG